jgi:hypothetical protein
MSLVKCDEEYISGWAVKDAAEFWGLKNFRRSSKMLRATLDSLDSI